jgi:hypothetical protein
MISNGAAAVGQYLDRGQPEKAYQHGECVVLL